MVLGNQHGWGNDCVLLFSLFGKREDFDLDKLLHRGKYAIAGETSVVEAAPSKGWKMLGMGKEFTRGDKIIYICNYVWTGAWLLIFAVGTIYNLTHDVDDLAWSQFLANLSCDSHCSIGCNHHLVCHWWFPRSSPHESQPEYRHTRSPGRWLCHSERSFVNQKEIALNIRRIEQFYNRMLPLILAETAPLEAVYACTAEPVPFAERLKLEYKPIRPGEVWGHFWESGWFRLNGTVPSSWRGKPLVAHLDLGGEALVFRPDGFIMQGVTNGSVFDTEFGRDIVRLSDSCAGGEKIELWVEGAANALFGMFCDLDPGPQSTNRYGYYDAKANSLKLAVFDTEMWQLTLDLKVLIGLIKTLPEASVRRARIIRAACEAINAYAKSNGDAAACRALLKKELTKPAEASSLSVLAVGHAHIDTAWLWPVRESIRKCARTFSTQLDLIDRYPDYVFGASQAQHYAFVKQYYPGLYDRIKAAVKAGRWEIQGGMWVEADCNVTSGESLVRQILHGKNFFRDEFGVDVDNLWLPDVFGYSAALPQILQKSGIRYFLTQKLSWSQFNDFPHHTFHWEGIDGTRVLTHFPPEDTYNSQLWPESLVPAQARFHERDYIDEFISLFGVGDGGGGPKAEHIEIGRRQANLEGAPRVRFGTAKEFFHNLDQHKDKLPTWVGELYLELHRGTLTTQAFVKWANRRFEQKLRVVEMLWSCLPYDKYPQSEIDSVWKLLLLNQFHDIIPGSSISQVYRLARTQYLAELKKCDELVLRAAGQMFKREADAVTLFNPHHHPYVEPVRLPDAWQGSSVIGQAGRPLPCQNESGQVVALVDIPPYSFVTLRKGAPVATPHEQPSLVLENDRVRYEFSDQGTLLCCFDKDAQIEIVAPDKPGNLLTLYDDHPNDWDAWDVDAFYRETPIENARITSVEYLSAGEVRQGVKFSFAIGQSTIEQRVYLGAKSKRLDFETTVDWREKHRMLRVAFPVTVRAEQATFDIQYGYLKRATHENTSWEKAKFEVPAHRYADLSIADHGVALLNDSKYGYKVENGLLDLNLLRSPNYPDPDADQGEHHFVYSLLPHTGDLIHSDVMAEAAKVNQPVVIVDGYAAESNTTPVRLTGHGLSMEVLKKAERESCWIVRVVETLGCTSHGTIDIAINGATLQETDLMEWTDGTTTPVTGPMALVLRPFEIRTYRIRTGVAK